jgi:hypothetical protein
MNKKILAALAVITLIAPVAAKAETPQQPTLAILDTAIDMTVPSIAKNVVYEACVLEWGVCPNTKSLMEGPGSATLPHPYIAINGFDHGTQMAAAAIQANPNVKIVFVRIIGNNPDGSRKVAGNQTIVNALNWVLQNKDRFNIQAVSMSQSNHILGPAGTDYCPKNPTIQGLLTALKDKNVGVFFPAGNVRDYSRISFPSCLPEAIAVGATMPTQEVAIYSNYDAKLIDFVALGTMRLTSAGNIQVNVAGTSASTQVAASSWVAVKSIKPNLTYRETLDLFNRTAIITKNSKVTGAKLINLSGALNG